MFPFQPHYSNSICLPNLLYSFISSRSFQRYPLIFSSPNLLLGYQAVELTYLETANFALEANVWTTNGLVSASDSLDYCASAAILGGYNTINQNGYIQTTYSGLPPHNIVYFQIKVSLLDHFVSPDTIQFDIGSKSFTIGDLGANYGDYTDTLCGVSGSYDLVYGYEVGKVFHTGDSIQVRLTSKIGRSPSVASFGIREVSFIFTNSTAGEVESYCYSIKPGRPNHLIRCL